ncbi:hypothetical protein ACSBR2_023061 [Camellia fascicularis]
MAEKKFLFFLAIIGVAGNGIALCNASIPMSSPPYTSKPPKIIPPSMPPFSPSPAPYAPGPAPARALPSGGIKGGYWPSSIAERFPPSAIPTKYFTHLFYAFVLPDATSYQLFVTPLDDQWMGNFTATLHAQMPPAIAFLSIGGGNSNSSTFSNMASSHDTRAAFIKSTIDVARKYDFDGLDLDWEFPQNPQDMTRFSMLFYEWRTATNKESLASGKPRLLLSAAVYFASNFFLAKIPRTYPGGAIKNFLDFVNPMCYDYHGSWDTSVTGAQALLFDKSSNVSTSYGISTWVENGVPPEKLVMGLPMYGRTWKLKDPNQNGIGAPANGTGPGYLGVMKYSDIVDFNLANHASVVFDEETVSTYSYAGTDWIGYDDMESISNKVNFARANGLGGYFFWAVGFDKNWTISEAGSLHNIF